MAWVAADDAHYPTAAHDLALIANTLNAGFDFHGDFRQTGNISIYGPRRFLFNPCSAEIPGPLLTVTNLYRAALIRWKLPV
jgi:hypothetical protein